MLRFVLGLGYALLYGYSTFADDFFAAEYGRRRRSRDGMEKVGRSRAHSTIPETIPGMSAKPSSLEFSNSLKLSFRSSDSTDSTSSNLDDDRSIRMAVFCSGATDCGGMKRNEDEYFIWQNKNCENVVLLGVFDGHGSDAGVVASRATKRFTSQWMDEKWPEMAKNPEEGFRTMFVACHDYLRKSFDEYLSSEGLEVRQFRDYLVKRKSPREPWMNVHGGTTATIVVICDGKRVISANVGDSSALMISKGRNVTQEGVAQQPSKEFCLDGEASEMSRYSTSAINNEMTSSTTENDSWLIMTEEHSPENCDEYIRFRDSHPSPLDPSVPRILMVYDMPHPVNKYECNPIYGVSDEGKLYITGKGGYYKNVRHEWASLICTPRGEMHQSALAFTRSLGDFQLHRYGVVAEPSVQEYTVDVLYGKDERENSVACIIVCSDGIWDNWLYEEVSDFFFDDDAVQSVRKMGSCDHIMAKFIEANSVRAKQNFGAHADNATAIASYILISSSELL